MNAMNQILMMPHVWGNTKNIENGVNVTTLNKKNIFVAALKFRNVTMTD
jgi:hypothetical protein